MLEKNVQKIKYNRLRNITKTFWTHIFGMETRQNLPYVSKLQISSRQMKIKEARRDIRKVCYHFGTVQINEILYQSFRLPDICFLANNVHIWFVVDTIAQQRFAYGSHMALSRHMLMKLPRAASAPDTYG